jgi:hypothetical protein
VAQADDTFVITVAPESYDDYRADQEEENMAAPVEEDYAFN